MNRLHTENQNVVRVRTREIPLSQFSVSEQIVETDITSLAEVTKSQLSLLVKFYNMSLSHSERSFRVAIWFASIGIIFFIAAIAFVLLNTLQITYISIIGAVLGELIASINFALYRMTKQQMIEAQKRLDYTQRFLLANNASNDLSDEEKNRTKAALIESFAKYNSQ
ncbi:MAG: hypothetical protein H6657_15280 [Ardenticatenaceae bacterium]|nr:hypothetical protein [Ardenticatenaceae bacterium]